MLDAGAPPAHSRPGVPARVPDAPHAHSLAGHKEDLVVVRLHAHRHVRIDGHVTGQEVRGQQPPAQQGIRLGWSAGVSRRPFGLKKEGVGPGGGWLAGAGHSEERAWWKAGNGQAASPPPPPKGRRTGWLLLPTQPPCTGAPGAVRHLVHDAAQLTMPALPRPPCTGSRPCLRHPAPPLHRLTRGGAASSARCRPARPCRPWQPRPRGR